MSERSQVIGGWRWLLRAEALLELAVFAVLYAHAGASWWMFAILFFTPDLAFFGYLANARVGAIAYNTTHSYVGPVIVALLGLTLAPATLPFALIWAAHVAFDRALGYGLKSVDGFRFTHLGVIGRDPG